MGQTDLIPTYTPPTIQFLFLHYFFWFGGWGENSEIYIFITFKFIIYLLFYMHSKSHLGVILDFL